MSWLSRLFSGSNGDEPKPEPVDHNGFHIFVDPIKESAGFRVAARIEKEIGGEVRTHRMVRADTVATAEAAAEMTLRKAKSLIDQQGESIFN
ncbi:HlyU family transcriptional regulator [Defluviimonas sp. WL0050]|uniref:HlyU family transcriptional regulator n=1 Tax=Albidovulum litorale TaxID=2984134 RepID=A0ABT2ZR21_9RHOB|nr:HlyU family transcriptional regulator [Defluviimonas sp. WL0050]MCV2873605.1 HlyU family transcriptional regulator [Defluviimonas sp. WL0050]